MLGWAGGEPIHLDPAVLFGEGPEGSALHIPVTSWNRQMFKHSRRMTVALSAVILALPAAARGQTGILHKRGPAVIQSLPAGVMPSAPAAGVPLSRGAGDTGGLGHAGGSGAAPGFRSGATKAPTTGSSGPRPDGLERAAAVASNFASGGLERASTATSVAADRGVLHAAPMASCHSARQNRPLIGAQNRPPCGGYWVEGSSYSVLLASGVIRL